MLSDVRDALDARQQYVAAGIFVAAVAAAFGAGYLGSTVVGGPTGAVTADASSDEVRQSVQSYMDQQLQRQRQRFQMIASQSPNISAEDLSMDATVSSVEQSQFGSLYKVTVSISGQVPGRTGGLQQVDQDQVLYISGDGRYLFRQPTDLQQAQQQAQQQTQQQAPAPGQ